MSNIRELPVMETISTAWKMTRGLKKILWAALGIYILIAAISSGLSEYTKPMSPLLSSSIYIIGEIIGFFLQAGIIYMAIECVFGSPVTFHSLFYVFQQRMALNLVILYILQVIIWLPALVLLFLGLIGAAIGVTIPNTILFTVPGIILMSYLTVRMSLAMGLVLKRQEKPWQAIKLSFVATRGNFWSLLSIFLLEVGIVFISLIPLGIGLIWTLPFVYVCYGLIYKRLSAFLPN